MPPRLAGPLLAMLWAAPLAAHPGHVHLRPQGSEQVQAAALELGRCVGKEPGAPARVAEGAPFDVRGSSMAAEERQVWESLDYRFDDKAGWMLNPDGTAVPAAEVERLRAPFDAAKEEMDPNLWAWLATSGFRLDESSCVMRRPEGGGFSRLEVLAWALSLKRSYEHSALEDLRAGLSALEPGAAVPDSLKGRAALLERQGLVLPRRVKEALSGAAAVKDVAGTVDAAYQASTRRFDGGGWRGALGQAAPAVPGLNTAPRTPTYAADPERLLGAALQADVTAVLGEHPSGRELLERLRGKDGKSGLPDLLVVKLSQRPGEAGYGQAGAVASPDGSFVAINYWGAREAALAAAPEQERRALAKRLATPEGMRDWLLADPDGRRAFVRGVDVILYHELVHIWQAKRGAFDVEMLRGNAPQVNPLEKEHEAYREQLRYFHDKLKADPARAAQESWFSDYQSLLADYGAYRDGITRQYMSNFPGSSDFKTAAQLQKERRRASRALGTSGWSEWARQGLRRLGFEWGDAAMKVDSDDAARREREFEERTLPAMRAEASEVLGAHFERAGRPAFALGAAMINGSQVAEEKKRALFERAMERLRRPGGDAYERARDLGHLAEYLNRSGTPPPDDFAAVQKRVYGEAAGHFRERAAKAEGAERARWLEWAEAYEKAAK